MTHFAEPLESQAIRDSAKGEPCLIRLPLVCNDDPLTTVLCHGRKYPGGGGASIKPDDLGAAYGCYACHCVVDGHVPLPDWLTREQVIRAFHDAHILTLRRLRAKGFVIADMGQLADQICTALCISGKFECGEGRCAPRCMEILGHKPTICQFRKQVHGALAQAIIYEVQSE